MQSYGEAGGLRELSWGGRVSPLVPWCRFCRAGGSRFSRDPWTLARNEISPLAAPIADQHQRAPAARSYTRDRTMVPYGAVQCRSETAVVPVAADSFRESTPRLPLALINYPSYIRSSLSSSHADPATTVSTAAPRRATCERSSASASASAPNMNPVPRTCTADSIAATRRYVDS